MSLLAPEPAPNVAQLLAFYLEAGVDCALGEEPVNRLADPEFTPAPPREAPQAAVGRPIPSAPMLTGLAEAPPAPDAAIASAREAARTAPTLEALRDLLEKFDGCALKSTATRLVFADGNPEARVMFVGEAPGREPRRRALCGAAGAHRRERRPRGWPRARGARHPARRLAP